MVLFIYIKYAYLPLDGGSHLPAITVQRQEAGHMFEVNLVYTGKFQTSPVLHNETLNRKESKATKK